MTRSIGVSNFSVQELDELLAVTTTKPVVDQVQFSPFEYRKRLLDACLRADVAVEAYSPLGTGRHLSNPVVSELANELGRTPAQVLLRWCLQRDTIVLPKSTNRDRIAGNAQVFDFELDSEVMSRLDALDSTDGTHNAREGAWWR